MVKGGVFSLADLALTGCSVMASQAARVDRRRPGGEGDGAVAVGVRSRSSHRYHCRVGDGPAFSVVDGLSGGGPGAVDRVVAAGGDDVADHCPLVVDLDERVLVEFAGVDAALLNVVVDGSVRHVPVFQVVVGCGGLLGQHLGLRVQASVVTLSRWSSNVPARMRPKVL